jgi:hypothetical protein
MWRRHHQVGFACLTYLLIWIRDALAAWRPSLKKGGVEKKNWETFGLTIDIYRYYDRYYDHILRSFTLYLEKEQRQESQLKKFSSELCKNLILLCLWIKITVSEPVYKVIMITNDIWCSSSVYQ